MKLFKIKNNKKGFTRTPRFGVAPKGGGFTLMETLITMGIFTLIIGALTLLARNVWTYNAFLSHGLTDTNAGRQVLKSAVAEIRTASTADTGAYTISQATASLFTFYSNIDSDILKEKIRYYVTGTTLYKGVTKPSGSPLSYNPANEKISTLATNLTTNAIFSYYNKNYAGSTAALTFPVNVAEIRLIKITLTIDQDPNRSPLPRTFTTQVSIRNLKDNL